MHLLVLNHPPVIVFLVVLLSLLLPDPNVQASQRVSRSSLCTCLCKMLLVCLRLLQHSNSCNCSMTPLFRPTCCPSSTAGSKQICMARSLQGHSSCTASSGQFTPSASILCFVCFAFFTNRCGQLKLQDGTAGPELNMAHLHAPTRPLLFILHDLHGSQTPKFLLNKPLYMGCAQIPPR